MIGVKTHGAFIAAHSHSCQLELDILVPKNERELHISCRHVQGPNCSSRSQPL